MSTVFGLFIIFYILGSWVATISYIENEYYKFDSFKRKSKIIFKGIAFGIGWLPLLFVAFCGRVLLKFGGR